MLQSWKRCIVGCGEGSVSLLCERCSHSFLSPPCGHCDGLGLWWWGRGGKGLCFIRAKIKSRMIRKTKRSLLIAIARRITLITTQSSRKIVFRGWFSLSWEVLHSTIEGRSQKMRSSLVPAALLCFTTWMNVVHASEYRRNDDDFWLSVWQVKWKVLNLCFSMCFPV